MATIKETLEVLTLAKNAAAQVKEVLKDGKVDLWDIPKLAPLWTPAKVALEGASLVPAELGDLDTAEVAQLMNASIAVAQAWADVFALAPKAA